MPSSRFALLVGTALAVLTAGLGPAAADPIDDAARDRELTAEEMVIAFNDAILFNLAPIEDPPPITGNAEVDDRIRAIAVVRGYERRPEPAGPLASADGRSLQTEAAIAWEELQAAAAAAGHSISLTSGYRSAASQARIWNERSTGTSDSDIDTLLQTVAAPGYSKHHTGYAIDLRSGGAVLDAFAATPAYEWLSADNFANAKAHGWLPSYPEGAGNLGPNPEAWEFVWVGTTNIVCIGFEPTPETPFCDTVGSVFTADIAWLAAEGLTTGCTAIWFCTDDNVTRGQAATFLWRLFEMPPSTFELGFDDVELGRFFEVPVRWMLENDITTGTSPTTFAPDDDLTRAQFVTFLWRAAGRPTATAPHPFTDVAPGSFAQEAIAWAAEVGITSGTSPTEFSPDAPATRGQIAAFLRRFADLDLI
ncbi:MAG: D-alanyl-D-alanine carboxypeptidase family protein [Actinomycetota bacterium]